MHFALIKILINPQFEVLLVFIASETNALPHFAEFFVHGIDVEVEIAIISFICGHEANIGLDRK